MTAKAKLKVDAQTIITMYMDHVLEHGEMPKSVFQFCKHNGIEEQAFYRFFGSFETLRQEVWTTFYANTESVMLKDEGYANFSNKEKLLTFFYSFFELLALNRSYVLLAMKSDRAMLQNLAQLKGLRIKIKTFSTQLAEDANGSALEKNIPYGNVVLSEGTWLQFLFLLKFWMDDSSRNFEKTDMAIEKSVNTVFELFNTTPLNSLLDFGKFLFKEKMR